VSDRQPTIRERRLAAELRRHRERSTLNLDAAVAALQATGSGRWSPAKLSRLETANQRIRIADLNLLLDLYQVTEDQRDDLLSLVRSARQRGWWDAYAGTIPTDYTAYLELEAEARSLRCYDALVINGLLQTAQYAREIISVGLMQFEPPSEVDRRVEIRCTRQNALKDRKPEPVRLWSIVDEATLHRIVGGPEAMREQYEHLLALAEQPNVMLQVLPYSEGAHPAITGTFAIMEFAEHHIPDVVYLDGLTSALYVENDTEVHMYSLAFNQLAMGALGVGDSLAMIKALAKNG
jgi:hypothetical protein